MTARGHCIIEGLPRFPYGRHKMTDDKLPKPFALRIQLANLTTISQETMSRGGMQSPVESVPL
jgi:chloramphenicol O-acetyltransferase